MRSGLVDAYDVVGSVDAGDVASAGFWVAGRNAAPRSMLLMLTAVFVLKLCWPVYATSRADAKGSTIWVPTFHCVDADSLLSYCQTVKAGAAVVVRPVAPRFCNWPYRTVMFCVKGGLLTVP